MGRFSEVWLTRGGEAVGLAWMRLARPREAAFPAAVRRAFAIHAYVGANGSGKTLAMIHDTLPSLEAGRRVLSTVRLVDPLRECPGGEECDAPLGHEVGGRIHRAAHSAYVPFTRWEQLLEAERCDVLMDEVTGVASSRESHRMPAPVANLLMQLRRRDVLLRWTAPYWPRADKVIREVTQAVTFCQGYAPVSTARDGRVWRDRRGFRWQTTDAAAFDEYSAHGRETLPVAQVQWFWRPGSRSERVYDTLDAVLAIGALAEGGGVCARCGGRRRAKACSCGEDGM